MSVRVRSISAPPLLQIATSTLTYGRDRLGRRSLLQNTDNEGVFIISSVSPERSSSPMESPVSYMAYEEVDCSSFSQINIREVDLDGNGKVDLAIRSKDLERTYDFADTLRLYRSFSQRQQLLSSGPLSTQ